MAAVGALLERLREGEVARALLRGSAVSLALNVAGQGLALLLQILFARLLGLQEYGVWSYAMAWLGVAVIAGKMGFDSAFVRFLPTRPPVTSERRSLYLACDRIWFQQTFGTCQPYLVS